jgi:hypothetical protein
MASFCQDDFCNLTSQNFYENKTVISLSLMCYLKKQYFHIITQNISYEKMIFITRFAQQFCHWNNFIWPR